MECKRRNHVVTAVHSSSEDRRGHLDRAFSGGGDLRFRGFRAGGTARGLYAGRVRQDGRGAVGFVCEYGHRISVELCVKSWLDSVEKCVSGVL